MATSTSALALIARELAQHDTDRSTWEREKQEYQETQTTLIDKCQQLETTNLNAVRRIKMLEHCILELRKTTTNVPTPSPTTTTATPTEIPTTTTTTSATTSATTQPVLFKKRRSNTTEDVVPSSTFIATSTSTSDSTNTTLKRKSSAKKYDTLPRNFNSEQAKKRTSLTSGTATSRQILRNFLSDMGYLQPNTEKEEKENKTITETDTELEPAPELEKESESETKDKTKTTENKANVFGFTGGSSCVNIVIQDDGLPPVTSKFTTRAERNSTQIKESTPSTISPSKESTQTNKTKQTIQSKPTKPTKQTTPTPLFEVITKKLYNPEDTEPTTPTYSKRKTVATLRAHLDVVRDISFHPTRPLVVSVSDDGMVKMWNLRKVKRSPDLRSAILNEPVRTCYSHRGPALCAAAGTDICCTGGADGIVRVWNMVPLQDEDIRLRNGPPSHTERDTYPHATIHKIQGHEDAVWSVDLLNDGTKTNGMVSVSADKTIRIWSLNNINEDGGGGQKEMKNNSSTNKNGVQQEYIQSCSSAPTSVVVPKGISSIMSHTHAFVGFRDGHVMQLDCGTGTVVDMFGGKKNDNSHTSNNVDDLIVNQIALHPSLNIALVASNDGCVRCYDPRMEKSIQTTIAHTSSTTCIACEPMGYTYATGCGDGDVRLWDLRTAACLQDMTKKHRPSTGECAVSCLAFHPTRGFLASGGSDSIIKIYQPKK